MEKYIKIKLPWILLCFLLIFADAAVFADETLTMGVFPRRNSGVTTKMFKPLSNYLSQETGVKIKLETAKNFPAFWRNVRGKRYDIAHFNQLHYLMSKDSVGYEVFAKNEEFGKSVVAPAIAVRKDSGINTLEDLKGKRIIFGGGKLAMIAHVGIKNLLYDAGLTAKSYTSMMGKNPPNAAMAVYFKKADAAGIGDIGLSVPILKKKININEMMIIETGKPHAHIPWVFKSSLPDDVKNKIKQAVGKLNSSPDGKKILKRAGMTGLVAASDRDYDASRAEMKKYNENFEGL